MSLYLYIGTPRSLRHHWSLLGPLLGHLCPVTNPVHCADREGHSAAHQGRAVQEVLYHPYTSCACILLLGSSTYYE